MNNTITEALTPEMVVSILRGCSEIETAVFDGYSGDNPWRFSLVVKTLNGLNIIYLSVNLHKKEWALRSNTYYDGSFESLGELVDYLK